MEYSSSILEFKRSIRRRSDVLCTSDEANARALTLLFRGGSLADGKRHLGECSLHLTIPPYSYGNRCNGLSHIQRCRHVIRNGKRKTTLALQSSLRRHVHPRFDMHCAVLSSLLRRQRHRFGNPQTSTHNRQSTTITDCIANCCAVPKEEGSGGSYSTTLRTSIISDNTTLRGPIVAMKRKLRTAIIPPKTVVFVIHTAHKRKSGGIGSAIMEEIVKRGSLFHVSEEKVIQGVRVVLLGADSTPSKTRQHSFSSASAGTR